MSVSDRIKPLTLTSYDASGFDGTYHAINPLGFDGPACYITISNSSNKAIFISFDGVIDHDYLLPDTTRVIPVQLNSQPTNNRALFSKNQKVYVKSAVAGAGNIYLTGYYQS